MSMRIAIAVLGVCLGASTAHAQNYTAAPADSQAIRDLIALHADASLHGDLARLTKGYQTDADVRFSDGTVLRGVAGGAATFYWSVRSSTLSLFGSADTPLLIARANSG